jgi:2-polyprenyl-3-methyl-5-hydroxy-6-metoxy-1,4-benzoquinol methylase
LFGIGAKASLNKRQETSRIESRFNELRSIFEKNFHSRFKVSSKISLEELIPKDSIRSYFDLGCGNGLITARIGSYFHLEKESIFGGDVFNSQNPQITFVSIDQNQSIIDLGKTSTFIQNETFLFSLIADQSVNLITCLVTLHHIPKLDNILKELARIIQPDGYLIIREHDCKLERSILTKYLHFIHAVMIIGRIGEFSADYLANKNEVLTWFEQKKKIINYTKSIQYKTRQEWQNKFESVGFNLLATFDYDLNKTTNPQRLFYAVYKRTQ